MAAVAPEPRPTERLASSLSGMGKVFAGFKEFISRGNAVELAVGVVVGAAFGAVITALQDDLISPLVGWIFGQPNLTDLWDIGPYSWQQGTPGHPISPIKVGAILNAGGEPSGGDYDTQTRPYGAIVVSNMHQFAKQGLSEANQ